ncbi:hypothetical protein BT93_E1813 [Corymbia citriodora subsp. variegata]|nr:hypothetical protein BT93_E1813 [Corymbia citriodora subsp. variegata]
MLDRLSTLHAARSVTFSGRTYLLFLHKAKLALDSLEVQVGCVIVEERHLIALEETRQMIHRIHAEMEALDVLLEQWRRTGFLSTEFAEKYSACSL